MDLDDILPPRKGDPFADLLKQDLDRLSVDELRDRIAALETELTRTRARLDGATSFRSQADELFKR